MKNTTKTEKTATVKFKWQAKIDDLSYTPVKCMTFDDVKVGSIIALRMDKTVINNLKNRGITYSINEPNFDKFKFENDLDICTVTAIEDDTITLNSNISKQDFYIYADNFSPKACKTDDNIDFRLYA